MALQQSVHTLSAFAVAVAVSVLAWLPLWQGVSAQTAQQATFTLSQTKGNCKPVVGYGARFPPGSTAVIDGPTINGRAVAPVGENIEIMKQVAADGTFTVRFNPCPHQLAFPMGNFPVANGDQFSYTADALEQSGVGASAIYTSSGVGGLAIYTVSGLRNARLPSTGVSANGGTAVGLSAALPLAMQTPLFAIILFAGAISVALGMCLLLFDRATTSRARRRL